MSEDFNDDELKALIKSNAKAIQALSEDNSELKRERAKLYHIMSDLAQSHVNLAQAHADNEKLLYRFMENIEEQQQQWKQRQSTLEERQDVIEEQQQILIKTQADITELLKFVINSKG